jgi:dienelactone hydrolase
MTKSLKRAMLAAATALACAPVFCAPAANPDPASIPVEAFFDFPIAYEPLLSPTGDAIAIEMRVEGRRVLAVIDTATLKKVTVVGKFPDGDVGAVEWVNNDRLVFDEQFEDGTSRFGAWTGLFAVNRDGSDSRRLIHNDVLGNSTTGTSIKARVLTADHRLLRTLHDNTNDVIVEHGVFKSVGGGERFHSELLHTVPMRLDTITGQTHALIEGNIPEHSLSWIVDDHGRVRADMTRNEGRVQVLTQDGDQWKSLVEFDGYGSSNSGIGSMRVGADGQLYVTRVGNSPERTKGLYRFDATSGRPDAEPLVSVKGFDFSGHLIEDSCKHKVLGIRYHADAWGTAWLDGAMAKAQARVDTQLPGRVNLIDVPSCGDGSIVLVSSSSDRSPPQFFLYSPADDHLRSISSSRPEINPRSMAVTDFYRIKARDGREFPVYVTTPQGKGPWPTVVLVHGGPNVRGWSWEWDNESEFLASRGYLVVKPEFRGSAGYGGDLLAAGFRQWGLLMQDDIADATRWAAAKGWADPTRTCIVGGSYGGYATLMGLVRYPDLYRCGVAYSAVADIGMMYETWWSDGGDDWIAYGMPVTVGDPEKDAAQFAATSPLKLAAHITQPLLLEHGALDRRVPIEQANAMRSALEANHKPPTWLYYPEEGHGLYIRKDRFDFYRHMETFLAANIGAAPAVAAQAAPATSH